jgi:hypothetical protein
MACVIVTFARKIPGHNARIAALQNLLPGGAQKPLFALGDFPVIMIQQISDTTRFAEEATANDVILRRYDCKQRYLVDVGEFGWQRWPKSSELANVLSGNYILYSELKLSLLALKADPEIVLKKAIEYMSGLIDDSVAFVPFVNLGNADVTFILSAGRLRPLLDLVWKMRSVGLGEFVVMGNHFVGQS